MSHPLQDRIAAVRGRARRLTLLYAASWVTGAVLLAVLALAGADYLVRFEDRGLRLISLLAVVAVAVWSAWRFLLPALAARWRDVEIALRVERRFPELNDRLASTVQFLAESEDAPGAGSAALRRAVIVQTTSEAERIPWEQSLDARPAARAAVLAAAVCFLTAAVAAWDVESATIAARRLFAPLGDLGWPQRHHLAVRDPVRRLALGDAFEVTVVDERGELPDEVQLLVRYEGDAAADEESLPMRFADGAFVYRREGVRRPFSYRAVGGDDRSMEEIQLEVVEPPAVQDVAVKLHYPAYTGWPAAAAEKNLRALRGTRVEIAATSTKPLRSARVEVDGGKAIAAALGADGYAFHVPATGTDVDFLVEESGTYRLLLEDREGVVGGRDAGYDVRAVADLPPTLTIEEPSANIFVTSDAVVPLVVVAKDDLALRDINLVYSRTDQSEVGDQTLPLHVGPTQAPPPAAGAPAGVEAGETRRLEDFRWELAPLALPPGTQVTFLATASDYLPQSGQSQPRRLTVVTRDELEGHVAERLSFILGELFRVVQMQRQGRTQIGGLEIQMRDVGRLTKQDLDRLQGAEMTQRQVDRQLTGPTEGIPAQVSGLLDDLENNKVDSPDIERRLRQLQDEIGRLEREHLPSIGQALTGAIKGAQQQTSDDPPDEPNEGAAARNVEAAAAQPDANEGAAETEPSAQPNGDMPPGETPADEAPSETPADEAPATDTGPTDDAAEDAGQRPAEEAVPRPRRDDPVSNALARAGEHQDQVIASLERMLGELTQSEAFSRLYREMSGVRREQQELAADTEELAQGTLGKETRDLTEQEQADLNKAAERQQELAQRFQQLGERMQELGETLAETDPLAADAVADALQEAQEQGIGPQMQEAARNVERNQMGQAGAQQGELDRKLEEVLDVLANRREQELDRLVKKLREAEAELERLRERQQGLRKKVEDAAANADEEARRRELEKLGREQRELADEAARFARKLERLQAELASRTASGAAAKMAQAGEQGEQGNSQQARDGAERAQRDLEDAQRQLAERRQQAEADLATEQLTRIEDSIRALRDRQQGVVEDTVRLDEISAAQGRLTRAQSQTVQGLSRLELLLNGETVALAEKIAAAKVFDLALRGAAREMDRAAGLLTGGDVGEEPQTAERNALRRLDQLIEALHPEELDPDMQPPQQGEEGGDSGQQGDNRQPTDGIPDLAQLKMVELLQREINERTKALEESYGRQGELTETQAGEYLDLSAEQGELAGLLLDLSQPAEEAAEEEMDVGIEYDEEGIDSPEPEDGGDEAADLDSRDSESSPAESDEQP